MKFTFFSNYFNHHQKALCDALYERLGDDFAFVETEPMEEFRANMGWGQEQVPCYVMKAYETAQTDARAMTLGAVSDVVMIGSAPERFVEGRIAENKLTFRYTERPLKEGWIKMLIPRLAKKYYHLHVRNRGKNVYLLGASAYASADYRTMFRSYPDKCYKFGYFPSVRECNLEQLMERKRANKPMTILWAGRFLKLKHGELLIQALGKLSKKGIDFRLRMIGSGEEEQHLKALTVEMHLEEKTLFLGFLSPEEVRVEMEKANIFVMTSSFLEGWGSVIYEGLSAGCAVVASHACGSAPWLVSSGANGYLFKSGSVKSLADKLERLLVDEAHTEELGRNAYTQMRDIWNPHVAAERLIGLAESLVAHKPVEYPSGPLSKAPVLKNNWFLDHSMKKVMYLLEYPIDLPGGAQMSTESLCQGLLSSEFEPIVVCPKLLTKTAEDYRFRILTYPMGENRIKNLLMRLFAFAKIVSKEKPEIVHIQMPESLITYGLLRGIGLFRRSHLIFTDRGMFFGYRKHSMLLMQHALKHADLMLCTTKMNQKLWLDGCEFRPVEVVANTINECFEMFDATKCEHEGFVLGFAGRICEEKNWPLAVKLCESLKSAGVRFRVSIVMSVFEAGDDEKVANILHGLYEAVGEENVDSHLDFSQEQMAEFYYGVDVFVMTSRFESFGKAAVEAMSRKCAVVSTRVGGLQEVIGKEENLYSEDTLEKAVAYIKLLSEDKEKRKADQEYFYERYRQEFSGQRCLEDHMKKYRGL